MKVRVTRKAYYDDALRTEGAILEIKEEDCKKDEKGKLLIPSWAELVDAKEEPKEEEALAKPKEQTLQDVAKAAKPKLATPSKAKAKKDELKVDGDK